LVYTVTDFLDVSLKEIKALKKCQKLAEIGSQNRLVSVKPLNVVAYRFPN